MFNLEHAIAEWRQQMLAAGIRLPVPLAELENHLRDEIEREMKLGLSLNEQEAIQAASQKIGAARSVRDEFKKSEEAKKARQAKLIDVLILAGASLYSLFIASLFLFKFQNFSELTSGQQMSRLAAAATFAVLIWGGRISHQILSARRARQIRNSVYVSSGVLPALWIAACFNFISPNHDFPVSQLLMTILWGAVLAMGAGIGFELGDRRRRTEHVALAGS